jgi:hypothetical protein
MAAPNSYLFTADPIHRTAAPAPNSSVFAADPVHQAASAAGMSVPPGPPPTRQVALMAPQTLQDNPMMHPGMRGATTVAPMHQQQEPAMSVPPQGGPVMAPPPFPAGPPPMMAPPSSYDVTPQTGTMMAMQLLQAVDMMTRPPLPAALFAPTRQHPGFSGSCSLLSALLLLD